MQAASVSSWPKRRGQRSQPPHLTHFIQVPIRKMRREFLSEVNGRGSRGRRGETQQTGTAVVQLELVTDTRPHTNMLLQSEFSESLWAQTITHYLSPPPPHSGMDFTAAQMGWPIKTQNHHLHHFRIHILVSFSAASSFPCVSVALSFFKLVYRTRWETACCPRCCFHDVISVVLRGCSFSGEEKKKASIFSSWFCFCS